MKTILIFGASGAHGVGGEHGGWADKLKSYIHQQLYSGQGKGEAITVYELGIPGEATRDLAQRLQAEITPRLFGARPIDTVVVLSIGGIDSKAVGTPVNFVATPEGYGDRAKQLIETARRYAHHVICISGTPVDESKTNPKRSPSGEMSYYTNSRRQQFDTIMQQTAEAAGVTFLPLFNDVPADWAQRCLYSDGLHPNDAGHQWIFERLRSSIDTVLS